MEAIISYLCKVAAFQKEVAYSEWCVATNTLPPIYVFALNSLFLSLSLNNYFISYHTPEKNLYIMSRWHTILAWIYCTGWGNFWWYVCVFRKSIFSLTKITQKFHCFNWWSPIRSHTKLYPVEWIRPYHRITWEAKRRGRSDGITPSTRRDTVRQVKLVL